MKYYYKEKINLLLGKVKDEFFELKYIGGLGSEFDFAKGSSYFQIRENGYSFLLFKEFRRIFINVEEINYINMFTPEVKKKNKSVLGRALIGGILLGPLGAVVGGVSGVGEKELKNYENILTINFKNEDKNYSAVFNCKNKKIKKLKTFLNLYFKNRIKETKEISIDNTNVADEILKLKELLDEGILTQEEFEKQKQKLLNT